MADNADLCVLPVNLASKLLGSGEKYQMLGLVTQGNLYFITNKAVADVEDFSVLKGKTVGLAQIINVPGLTLKAALNRNEAAWAELKDGVSASDEKVNLKGLTSNAAIDGTLSYYLAAEPFVTMKTMDGDFRVVGDLQTLYNGVGNENVGYPQAVLVAKRDFLNKNAKWTADFLKKLAGGGEWLKTASAQDIYINIVRHFEDVTHNATFSLPTLTKECISRCGISFAYAKDCSTRVNEFLAELITVNANAAKAVEDDFYWLG
jgi:NitT/TauT family transport system substrate-binding protein